jgi:ATP-dependent Clp protease ATP-binding subunit ClpC
LVGHLPMKTIARYFDPQSDVWRRFTHRAQLVMAVADQFALEQGTNEIRPEHILRALASVDRGVGRSVLEDLDIDLFKLLPDIVKLLPRCKGAGPPPFEADLGDAAHALLAAARCAGVELGHRYVGTEHLVLGILADSLPASEFLKQRGATYELALAGVQQLLGEGR